ncbi:sodium-coupled monocarboxylate transporter 1-like [Littorina saxatilis]|uniref:Sodium-dependent multivitamin transporter n=1 Tax=Littorina saxatilis TaxID=31220 RepID=A0AAN9GNC9_9CAEN
MTSTTTTMQREFHWADYVVFSSVLFVSAAIGLFSAVKHRKATPEQLLTGNRKLPLLPVALSLAASFMSAIFVLGVPAEAYINSAEYWLIGLGYIPAEIITCFVIMPVFYKLKLTSAYEYLELRFNRLIRILGSLTFTLEMLLYMAVVMYAPALALSQVTNLSMEVSILATGLVCTFYTALGGIKAVVWTDAFQMLVILAGFLTLTIRGASNVGGWDIVMQRAFEGQRFTWSLDVDPNPFVRHTVWTLFIGGTVTSLTVYAANQALLQRYLSMRSVTSAKWAIMLHLPISEFFLALAMMSGLVMYAFYYNCDPMKRGLVAKPDQLMPYFMMETLGDFPGLPGLFVACIYSAALSTVSSGVNSLAAVTLEDFLKSWLKKLTEGKASNRLFTIVTVASAIFYGLVTIGLAYLAGVMGKQVLQIALSIFGMVGGPLLGLILVGMFFPCVNSWGAGVGLAVSLVISFWVGLGAIFNPRPSVSLLPALNTRLCNISNSDLNMTFLTTMATSQSSFYINSTMESTTLPPESGGLADTWYRLSYQHYGTLAVIISVVVGIIVSAITGFNKNRELDRRTYYDILGLCKPKAPQRVPEQQAGLMDDAGNEHFENTRL